MKRTDAILYLRRYYNAGIPAEFAASESLAESFFEDAVGKAAVEQFQRDFGSALTTDGVLGEKTLRAMQTPRCGCTVEMLRSDARLAMWPKRDWKADPLTYRFEKYVPGIDDLTLRGLAKEGTEYWMEACGIWIREAKAGEKEDVVISTGEGRRDNFDGPSGTLAWAYVAGGLIRFDLGENWTADRDANGISWLEVFDHEFGHTLGMGHDANKNEVALMDAFYKRGLFKPQAPDIREAQARYGKPTWRREDPKPPTEPKPPAGWEWAIDSQNNNEIVLRRAV